ncbi:MAG: hypothetical protein AB1758_16625, partial [Candidatus Eremiobacterota bacterium]
MQIGAYNGSSTPLLSRRVQSACQDRFQPQDPSSLQQNLDMARQMRELAQWVGKGTAEADKRVATLEQNTKLAAEPPRQFSPETHAEVAAYL